jgi:hypothetical protein
LRIGVALNDAPTEPIANLGAISGIEEFGLLEVAWAIPRDAGNEAIFGIR